MYTHTYTQQYYHCCICSAQKRLRFPGSRACENARTPGLRYKIPVFSDNDDNNTNDSNSTNTIRIQESAEPKTGGYTIPETMFMCSNIQDLDLVSMS